MKQLQRQHPILFGVLHDITGTQQGANWAQQQIVSVDLDDDTLAEITCRLGIINGHLHDIQMLILQNKQRKLDLTSDSLARTAC